MCVCVYTCEWDREWNWDGEPQCKKHPEFLNSMYNMLGICSDSHANRVTKCKKIFRQFKGTYWLLQLIKPVTSSGPCNHYNSLYQWWNQDKLLHIYCSGFHQSNTQMIDASRRFQVLWPSLQPNNSSWSYAPALQCTDLCCLLEVPSLQINQQFLTAP